MSRGMSPDEAHREAVRMFGGVQRVREEARDARGVAVIENLARDLRYTLRGLRREPLLLVAAAMSIALGAAANIAVFSLARAFLLASPDARRPEQLVQMRVSHSSHVTFQHWRDLRESGALADVAGYSIEKQVNWFHDGAAESITPMLVTSNFFELTGVPLSRGRGFTEAEARADNDPHVAVVSDAFWRHALAGDPGVVGRSLLLNGEPYAIVGMLIPRLRSVAGHGIAPQVYLPLNRSLVPEILQPGAGVVQLIGRLRPDQTMAQGRSAMDAADRRLGAVAGDTLYAGVDEFAKLGGIGSAKEGRTLGGFFVLLGVVSLFVLLIACANVAGLLVARGTTRRREIAIRLAIGGTRARLVQQFLAEGFWLALFGTGAGLVLSVWFMRLVNGVTLPLPFPIDPHLALDRPALVCAVAVVLVSTLLCALLPAVGATRLQLTQALKREERSFGARRLTSRAVLLTGQVAVSTVLVVTALLFVQNLARTQTTNPGFRIEDALTIEVGFAASRPDDDRTAWLARAVDRARGLPGVERVSFANAVPLTMHSGSRNGRSARFDDRRELQHVEYAESLVGPEYFATMGIGLTRGREFLTSDRVGAPDVAIVNQEFGRRYFGGGDPVGHRVRFESDQESLEFEIVGEVANSKHATLGEEQRAAVYFPLLQHPGGLDLAFLLVRAAGDPAPLVKPLAQAIGELDRSVAVAVQTMRSALAFAVLPSRIGAALLGLLGGLGLVLAAFGLYAIVSYNVSRRLGEIAIRMALGATRGGIARLVVRDASVLVGVGLVLGLGLALLVTRPLAQWLVEGLSASDPASYLATALVFLLVSVLASWIPARQAVRVSPVIAMRAD